MEKYLKDKQYYIDLYDRHTVEHCRIFDTETSSDSEKYEDKDLTKEQIALIEKGAREWILHIKTGERYLYRDKTIREWMDRDEEKDKIYETAQAPENIRCLTCRNRMNPTFKDMWHDEKRVLFMYDCINKCLPRRAFFSDGEEWRTKPDPCPKCDGVLSHEDESTEKMSVSISICKKCGYTKRDEHEWLHKKEDRFDPNFAADRDRYCISEEDGRKYQDEKWNMESMKKFMEEWDEEQKRRAEKLKENPKGFHLDGRGYTCAICHNGTPDGDNWYDEYGIKCLICQKAIDEGEIPAVIAKDKDLWYTKYDIESCFNVKGPALRAWIKKGIIKPRTVSHYGKGSWYEMFLIEDNESFLPPKNLVKSHSVSEKKDGKTWTHMEPWYKFVNPVEHLKGYKIMNYLRVIPQDNKSIKKRPPE